MIVDPSATRISTEMQGEYAEANDMIAVDRQDFGLSMQMHHLTLSHSNIQETALGALQRSKPGEARTAIVLGAGGCVDLPIDFLVSEFDRTTFVDIDTKHTEMALSSLSTQLLGKVSLVKADIAGVAPSLESIFEQASQEEDFYRFTDMAARLINSLDVVSTQLQFNERFSFVCSQLLMTQLMGIPTLHFNDLVKQRYGLDASGQSKINDTNLELALNMQGLNTRASHISHLQRITRPNGTVHLADTLAIMYAGGQPLPMVTQDVLRTIDMYFDHLRPSTNWMYDASFERQFYVGSYALTPKTTIATK